MVATTESSYLNITILSVSLFLTLVNTGIWLLKLHLNDVLQMNLHVKLPPSCIHFLPFMKALILSKLCIKRSLLKPPHFHRKSRPQLLQSSLRLFLTIFLTNLSSLFKYTPMMPHKNEITLIMKRPRPVTYWSQTRHDQ